MQVRYQAALRPDDNLKLCPVPRIRARLGAPLSVVGLARTGAGLAAAFNAPLAGAIFFLRGAAAVVRVVAGLAVAERMHRVPSEIHA